MARLSYCISSKGISAFSGIYMSNIKLGIYLKHKIKDIYILFYHKKKFSGENKNYKWITKDRETNDDLNIGFGIIWLVFF